ncbi:hypothetical protein D9615_009626 [Tricholomella constricta]|uniref:Uncharacterized protein n=1 Tax=Tricholomella constricta TaxID=117010 RepID=A0A8H5LW13_9AGAR|nr:hypothetical protein D9615_009626 [Tricholomella constricta]
MFSILENRSSIGGRQDSHSTRRSMPRTHPILENMQQSALAVETGGRSEFERRRRSQSHAFISSDTAYWRLTILDGPIRRTSNFTLRMRVEPHLQAGAHNSMARPDPDTAHSSPLPDDAARPHIRFATFAQQWPPLFETKQFALVAAPWYTCRRRNLQSEFREARGTSSAVQEPNNRAFTVFISRPALTIPCAHRTFMILEYWQTTDSIDGRQRFPLTYTSSSDQHAFVVLVRVPALKIP